MTVILLAHLVAILGVCVAALISSSAVTDNSVDVCNGMFPYYCLPGVHLDAHVVVNQSTVVCDHCTKWMASSDVPDRLRRQLRGVDDQYSLSCAPWKLRPLVTGDDTFATSMARLRPDLSGSDASTSAGGCPELDRKVAGRAPMNTKCGSVIQYASRHAYLVASGNVLLVTSCGHGHGQGQGQGHGHGHGPVSPAACLVQIMRLAVLAVQLDVGLVLDLSLRQEGEHQATAASTRARAGASASTSTITAIASMLEPNVIDYQRTPGSTQHSQKVLTIGDHVATLSLSTEHARRKRLYQQLLTEVPRTTAGLSTRSSLAGLFSSSTSTSAAPVVTLKALEQFTQQLAPSSATSASTASCIFRALFRRTAHAQVLVQNVLHRGGDGSTAAPPKPEGYTLWQVNSLDATGDALKGACEALSAATKSSSAASTDIVVVHFPRGKSLGGGHAVGESGGVGSYLERQVQACSRGLEGVGTSAVNVAEQQIAYILAMLDASVVMYNGASTSWTLLLMHTVEMQCGAGVGTSEGVGGGITVCRRVHVERSAGAHGRAPVAPASLGFDLTLTAPEDVLATKAVDNAASGESDTCGEPLWCQQVPMVTARVAKWQLQRDVKSCKSSNFLLYTPHNFGIGALVHQVASALSVAACSKRILYLVGNEGTAGVGGIVESWKPEDAKKCAQSAGTSFECYFERVTPCTLSKAEIGDMSRLPELTKDTWSKLHNTRIVVAKGGITDVPCSFCSLSPQFPFLGGLSESAAFLGHEAPIMASLVRFLLRPQPWFRTAVADFILNQTMNGHLHGGDDGAVASVGSVIPRPFASVHVRYGDKVKEAARAPLRRYIALLSRQRPDVRHIFLSTETADVLKQLQDLYGDRFVFHAFNYQRIETAKTGALSKSGRQEAEFVASFANLHVSLQADVFVGSLTSNWCRLLHELERTRGDGGVDYLSVDSGSQFSRCYGM